jgi:1-acyl-sn-glycerol-3-phosphate acyltransferase
MAKQELFQHWFSKRFYRLMGSFSVNRDKVEVSTIKSAKAVLQSGNWHLGIFPEGTRSEVGEVKEVKKGAAFMAKMAKAPILPIGITRSGTDLKDITVRIGKLIPCEGDVDEIAEKLQQALIELTNYKVASPK